MLGANAIRNPWSSASKLEDFQYFLCPECNEKHFFTKSKEDFIKHALGQHKLAANYISELIVKEEFLESNENDENNAENVEYSSDTNYDIGKKHALKKYDQFTLNTSCFWRSTGSNIIPILQFHEKIFITYYYC